MTFLSHPKSKIIKYIVLIIVITIIGFIFSILLQNTVFYELVLIYFKKINILLNFNLLSFGNSNITITSIISFLFILYFGFNLGKFYKKFIYSLKMKNRELSYGTITILAKIGYYIIIIFVIITSLKVIGIDLSSLTMIISALSVGIGFGLQGVVSNFISGIILMFEQSIKEGDYIEIGDELRGTVMNINMRSTTIRTNNNIHIIVPNKSFTDNNIINWTLSDDIIRFQIPFGVAYGTDINYVEKVLLDDLFESYLPYIKDIEVKKPKVIMTGMGNNSVDFDLIVWIKGNDTKSYYITKGKFLRLIYECLNKNNISIPFPQTDLHIKDSIPLEIIIK